MSKKTILIIFITILALIAGGLFGYYKGLYKGKDIGFDEGWQAADKRLGETGFVTEFARNREIKYINGEVKSVEGNSIQIKIRPLLPLADPDLDVRIVEVNEATRIIQIEEIATELSLDGFVEQRKEADISVIKPGQYISVLTGTDIKYLKQFQAVEIVIPPQE